MLKDKKILLGITGSIAAYKSILLVRQFLKAGAEVKVIVTPAARDFVSPLTLSTLSKNPVFSELFQENSWTNHVMLGRWADVMLIAPLSCNSLAKMANGFCDNLLLATYLSATCPVIVAPAMDEDMWHHTTTKKNLEKLLSFGNNIIPVDNGELASGLFGEGRMAEPEVIIEYISDNFFSARDLVGKKALVTAGPTYEAIDPVRFIGNRSSGKMGLAISEELAKRGADVDLVLGPSNLDVHMRGIRVHKVQSAAEMYDSVIARFEECDIAVMSAAVADYTPIVVSHEKIKKATGTLILELTPTKDILHTLGHKKRDGQIVVGFALESRNEKDYALQKLSGKRADMIVLNSLNDEGAGFGHDTNKITIFEKDGSEIAFERKNKKMVAADIVDRIVKMLYE
ncbi:MAG: bifunctional phosphopantothenoylcysteine decarboxylase/phosphopantothenate--cysteine ligase CoaBC [Chitinophagaceae bacterium]